MAKAKKEATTDSVSLDPEDPATPRPRLHKLIIKNFRAIGNAPVEIELDEIVVLVGPNNVGKSSILRAYEVVMKQGSSEGKLQIDDFPNGVVDPNALPEIELQTIVFDNAPGKCGKMGSDTIFIQRWSQCLTTCVAINACTALRYVERPRSMGSGSCTA